MRRGWGGADNYTSCYTFLSRSGLHKIGNSAGHFSGKFMRTVTVTVQLKHNFSRERQADVDSNLHTADPDWFTASADTVLGESFVLYHFVFLGDVSAVLGVCLPQTTASFVVVVCLFFVWLYSWLKISCKLFPSWLKNNCKLFPSWLKNNCTN